jgi:hypothetical protein
VPVHAPGNRTPLVRHLERNTITVPNSRTFSRFGFAASIAILACSLTVGGVVSPALADDVDEPSGVDLRVDVLGPESTIVPVPARPDSPPITSNRPTVPTGGQVAETTVDSPAEADDALGEDLVDLGGVLYISGLTSSVSPTLDPGNGSVSLSFTVRNVADSAFDSTARFWIDNAFGVPVAEVTNLRIQNLEPGETRIVTATMRGIGQWTVLGGHVTLIPPDEVDGTELSPLTRDTTLALAPLFVLLLVAGGAALTALVGLAWLFLRRAGFAGPFALAAVGTRG